MMASKKHKRPKGKAITIPPISPGRYEHYYYALEQGEELAHQGQDVFWDIGKGERPNVVLAHFRQVARKENIPVTIEIASKDKRSLVFRYSTRPESVQRVRIVSGDGALKVVREIEAGQSN